jgi:hypothetical protein
MKTINMVVFLLFSSFVFAQEHQHEMEKLGHVNFSTSCNAAAQTQFNRAVAILHSFGYEEAANAFSGIAKTDPQCAMAYWGVAMTYYHPIWSPPTPSDLKSGAEAIEKAKATGKPTEREKQFINALSVFYKDSDKVDHRTRAAAYSAGMKEVAAKNPDDDEAQIFYALALRGTADPKDMTFAIQKQSAEILNRILKKEPEHPGIAHYLIHDYDYPGLAELALPAARIYSKIAPSAPHALHMPSHIFTRLGLWQESIDSNSASEKAAVEHAQMMHPGSGSFNALHAMDYLMYAYLQTGRDAEAKGVIDRMNAIPKLDQVQPAAAYAIAAIPARYAIERNRWSEASSLETPLAWFPWKDFPWAQAITYFARGIGAARSGDVEGAKKDLAKLDELHQASTNSKDNYDWATQVEIQQKAVAAWIALEEKNDDEALHLMTESAELDDANDKSPVTPGAIIPSRELLGDMLLEVNQAANALVAYEKSLSTAPNRFHALSGAKKAAELSGDRTKAESYSAKLKELCGPKCERAALQ